MVTPTTAEVKTEIHDDFGSEEDLRGEGCLTADVRWLTYNLGRMVTSVEFRPNVVPMRFHFKRFWRRNSSFEVEPYSPIICYRIDGLGSSNLKVH